MRRLFQTLTAVAGLLAISATQPAQAQEQTITVTVIGEAQAMPDLLQIGGTISESSKKMKDAVTAFRDTQRRTLASIKALEIENLETKTSNLSISVAGDQQMANQFGFQQAGEPKEAGSLTISQRVDLTILGVDKLEEAAVIDLVVELMDGAKEAGIETAAMDQEAMNMMRFGMPPTAVGSAVFKLSDPEALRKQAMKDAMTKARADAIALAELAGAKLGGVVGIGDNGTDVGNRMSPMMMWYGMQSEEAEPYTTTNFAPIKVGQPLTVTFKLITE